jgi:hypothetical protein
MGYCTGDFERQVKKGSRNGAILCMGATLGEPEERAPSLGTLTDISMKALETPSPSTRAPSGKPGGRAFFLRTLRDMYKKALETEHLFFIGAP